MRITLSLFGMTAGLLVLGACADSGDPDGGGGGTTTTTGAGGDTGTTGNGGSTTTISVTTGSGGEGGEKPMTTGAGGAGGSAGTGGAGGAATTATTGAGGAGGGATTTTGSGGSTGSGPMCGDGSINGTEQCDDTLLNNETCVTQGFDAGMLACDGNCNFDTTGCTSLLGEQAYLKAANAEGVDYFGGAVAISGDTIVVGAVLEGSNQTTITNGPTASADNSVFAAGAAYVYVRSAGLWSEQAYLKPANTDAGDRFGDAVAISGNTILVGARFEDSSQTTITNGAGASSNNSASDAGAAYVFTRSGTTWTEQAYLKAANAGADDEFGFSVAIAGDTAVVGAWAEASNQTTITNGTGASSNNTAGAAGAAYVFTRSGTTWTEQAYLKAANAEALDEFGVSVAISGNTIVVGAWAEESSQTTITNGATASADNSASEAGAAYVFTRSGTTWTEQAYLKAANAESSDYFGWSVAISGDTVVVGAWGEDSNQTTVTNGTGASANDAALEAGAAYVFTRSGTTWTEQAYLKASNAEAADNFGARVAISGDAIVVSAYGEDSNQTTVTNGAGASSNNSADSAGAAYLFTRAGTTWSQSAYLKAANAEAFDYFGDWVSISGTTLVVGASYEDSNQTTVTNGPGASSNNSASEAGAAYVYVF